MSFVPFRIFAVRSWPAWLKIALICCLGVAFAVAVSQATSQGSWFEFIALIVATVGITWSVGRVVSQRRGSFALPLLAAGAFALGALAAIVTGRSLLAMTCLALGLLFLLGLTAAGAAARGKVALRSREWFDALSRGHERSERPIVVARFLGGALLGVALLSLLAQAAQHGMWGLSAAGGTRLLIIFDALVGGVFTYLVAGVFVESKFARCVGTLAWIAAGSRLGPNLVTFAPTFVLPAFTYLLLSQKIRLRSAILLFAFPIAVALVAPAMLQGVGIIAISALFIPSWTSEDRRAGWLSLLSVAVGGVVALALPSLLPATHVLVAPELDGRLRDMSADGAFPWEWLYPSLTGSLGAYATSLYAATGRVGNMLTVSSSLGEAAIVGTLLAWLVARRINGILPRFPIVLLLVSVFFALPSRFLSVPLPTFASVLATLVPNTYLVASAAACVALAGALMLAAAMQVLERERAAVAMAIAILVLVLQILPNKNLFVRRPDLEMSQAIDWVASAGGKGVLLASLFGDDPWALYGKYALESAKMPLDTLPAMKFDGVRAPDRRACYAIVNYGAYQGYGAPGLSQYVFTPPLVSGEEPPALEVPGLELMRVYGNVVVYKACR